MRGKCSATTLALLVAAGLLATAAPAGATIVISDGPGPALSALAGPGFAGTAPNFATIPNPNAAGIGDASSNVFPFPRGGAGQFLVLSTGDATLGDQPEQAGTFPSVGNGGGLVANRGDTALDVTTFQVSFNGLAAVSCLSFDFRFLSEEYPEFIDSPYNDAFIAELDATTWTTSGSSVLQLGNDFALDPNGNPVTIKATGPTSMSPIEGAGTPYDGATAPLRAQVPVPAGANTVHTLYLSIFDQQDDIYDTAAFIDNLLLTPTTNCPRGSSGLGPAVSITGPAGGSTVQSATATITGTANGPNNVIVRVYQGDVAAGAPVQELTAARSGTSWSATTAALPDGQYTAQATQAGADGINGLSGTTTFTIDTLSAQLQNRPSLPIQQVGDRDGDGIPDNLDNNDGSRPPVPGKSVQVRVVSGDVYIKLPKGGSARAAGPGKGFVPLKGAANIPMGSQLDTEDGRIALTSAADTGAVKVQTADFYQGIFEVKQAVPKKKPKKPQALVTDLVMKGQIARSQCAPLKGARAAGATKKKGPKSVLGQLWGNGKGKFRTSGKYSSATVRGTIWLTQDRCDGTLTKVTRGVVQVRDFRRKKTVSVKAGKSYLARAARAAAKTARKR
jgi:Bacterial Ig domain